ncbi:MAG: ABC transporter permease [Acidimicrobiia bacterium]
MRTATLLWARSEISRRWRSLVALGVLAGLVGGLALAAVAGARRTSTAYDRYREATGRSDAIVFASLAGSYDTDYAPVRNLPEVEDAGEFALTTVEIEGIPGSTALAPNDDHLYRTINRPLLVAGRLPDPRRADEVFVNRQAAKELDLHVGSKFTVVSATSLDVGSPYDGPTLEVTVVGIGDTDIDLAFMGGGPSWTPSAAMLASHPEVPRIPNLVVRLRPGTDVAEFGRRASEALGIPNVPVRIVSEDTKRVTRGTDLERTALLLFAGAVALAGVVLVGQALTRTVYAMEQPASALRALGFTRTGLVAGLVAPLAVTAVSGMIVAAGAAVAMSRWFPLGLAGTLEPDPGVHADWLVLLPGALAVALVTLSGAVVSAHRATSRAPSPPSVVTRLSVVPALRRLTVAPLPAVIGAGFALERGEGQRQLPVRPALVSAVAAILGVVGAFGLLHGIDDALARPDRSGQFWDVGVLPPDQSTVEDLGAELAADAGITDVHIVSQASVEFDGASVPVYTLQSRKGARTFTLLEGRRAQAPDEVVIGPATARVLGKGIGDTVRLGGDDRELRVVGSGLLPQTPHFSFDQGAWMTLDGFEAVAPTDTARESTVLVGFGRAVDVEEAVEGLRERYGDSALIEPSALPQDVGHLRNVRVLPKALAAFLVLLGLGALAHVLATAVRRRRHDLAVLRALGFRPLQVAACVSWQAVTVSLVALLAGIPLGIATGRWVWRLVAESTPLLYVPPVAVTVAALAIPASLMLANVMAALPARRAARLRPAEVLRAE